jgi:uncharacterized RDD family membrane protein YckC
VLSSCERGVLQMSTDAAELQIASIPRRIAAVLVDTLSAVAVIALAVTTLRRSGIRTHRIATKGDWLDWAARAASSSTPIARGIWLAADVARRNGRSPGARLLGLRRADAQTGGPVTPRSAIVRMAITTGYSMLTKRLSLPFERRAADRTAEVQPELTTIRRLYAADRTARQRALMDFYKANNVNPIPGLVVRIPAVLLPALTTILSPRHQSLADRLAGIITIKTRPAAIRRRTSGQ